MDSRGGSPLNFAVKKQGIDIINLLIESGADANSSDRTSWSQLTIAIYYGTIEIVSLLIEGVQILTKRINKAVCQLI